MSKQQAYGTWVSPITASMVTAAGVRLGNVAYHDDAAYWAEARPENNGQFTIVKARSAEDTIDLTSAPFNPRTRVHEYGGGSWWVNGPYLYFVHWDDQRLYRLDHTSTPVKTPQPITPEPDTAQALRYADGSISPDGQWVVCVRESHDASDTSARNDIVLIRNEAFVATSKQDEHVRVLVSGADFYSTPRWSPDGSCLSWIQWSHPQMPWDGTELMRANVGSDMSLQNAEQIAGSTTVSVMGALWTSKGELLYASDESGWWNIYHYSPSSQRKQALTRFTDREVFGLQRFVELDAYGFQGENHSSDATHTGLAMLVTHQAHDQLHIVKPNGQIAVIETPFASISSIAAGKQGQVLIQGQTENQQVSISLIDCHEF